MSAHDFETHRCIGSLDAHCSIRRYPKRTPTYYTYDELVRLAESKLEGDGCYSKSERMFWKMVLHAVAGSSLGMMR